MLANPQGNASSHLIKDASSVSRCSWLRQYSRMTFGCAYKGSSPDLKGATMTLLGKFGCVLILSFAAPVFAFGQQYPQNPPASTPPTFPEGTKENPDQTQRQNPDQPQPQSPETSPNPRGNPDQYPPQNPDQTAPTSQNTAPPPSSLTKNQTAIENAIRQQIPSIVNKVSVGITNDDRIQLSGNVDTEQEKQQIEQVAQSAAPDARIVNSISVGKPPTTSNPPLI